MIQSAQNKVLRIINFKQSMEPSETLYLKLKMNKLKNNIIKKINIEITIQLSLIS